ncbi:pre-b-cell leukemia transcription [Lynx pardinus]|uniref:Pre-b-cell leukemia transcription n=1 Tax=Lynx pardinus TaxID=191816 RepID=A0A485NBL8_LYNPA|nr:pre-b-cell leukemia transcription [Lynx pardinus]
MTANTRDQELGCGYSVCRPGGGGGPDPRAEDASRREDTVPRSRALGIRGQRGGPKHALNCHRMKPALFSVLCEIKEKTGKRLRPTVGLETPEVGSELLLPLSS